MGVGPQHCGMYGYGMGIGMPMGYVYGYGGYMYCYGHCGGWYARVVVQLALTVVVVWVEVTTDNTRCVCCNPFPPRFIREDCCKKKPTVANCQSQ